MPSTPVPLKSPALRSGDTIAIIAPASNIKRENLESGCAALRHTGYNPIYLDSICDQDLYFAGPVDRRIREFEEMFAREDVRAIICARGGYGSNYLLDKINLDKIKAHPKIFVGCSDVTALLTYLNDAIGLITFHGPMAAGDWARENGVNLSSWGSALTDPAPWELNRNAASGVRSLLRGSAEGVLYGGCLSILVASLGTPYEIKTDGKILFVEDVAEKPYKIDRMLMQLKLAGKLNGVRGLVFGEMLDCVQNANQGYSLEDVIIRIVGDLGIPIAYGLRSGHVTKDNITLPIGVGAKLTVTADGVNLKMLEAAVRG
jgi:muramoyltetrapeptide carboxypeptidase